MLEGPVLIEEAARIGLPFESVLATPEFLEGADGRRMRGAVAPTPLEVDPALLRELSDVDAPQGILAVASLPRGGAEALPLIESGIYLYAEGIQDPGNLGALARSLEAAGGSGLALAAGCVHPNHPRALRASAGSLLRIPVARGVSAPVLRDHLAGLRPTWIALTPRDGGSLYDADFPGAVVLAIGAEGAGLLPETVESCELALTVPIESSVESLNAAVAASVVLFEIRRRRDGGARDTPPDGAPR